MIYVVKLISNWRRRPSVCVRKQNKYIKQRNRDLLCMESNVKRILLYNIVTLLNDSDLYITLFI